MSQHTSVYENSDMGEAVIRLPDLSELNKTTRKQAMHHKGLPLPPVSSNSRPQIRIIHIFAPEIIKTDVANFRELVQRLTGKPTNRKINKKRRKSAMNEGEERDNVLSNPVKIVQLEEKFRGSFGYNSDGTVKEEIFGSESSCGFLSGLGEYEGLVNGFSEFPLFPFSSSHMDVFSDIPLSL